MASFARVFNQRKSILDEYYSMIDDAEENRERESKAAILIQSLWRGYTFRKYFEELNIKATKIQSVWRLHRCVNYVGILRTDKATAERNEYFNQQAVKIQRVWRGYWCRTQTFDYYKQQQFLLQQALKNAEMELMLENYNTVTNDIDYEKEREREIQMQEDYALANHHLVSTSNIPSVFTARSIANGGQNYQALENYIRTANRARICVPSISPR